MRPACRTVFGRQARTGYAMSRMLKRIDTFLDWFENISVVLFLSVATILSFIEVVLRYGFETSIIWSSEVVIVCIIWAVFIGLPLTLRKGGHIRVDVVVNLLRGKKRTSVLLLATAVGILFSVLLFIFSFKYAAFLKESGEVSITTDIPEYLNFLALPVGGFLLSIRYVQEIWRVLNRTDESTPVKKLH